MLDSVKSLISNAKPVHELYEVIRKPLRITDRVVSLVVPADGKKERWTKDNSQFNGIPFLVDVKEGFFLLELNRNAVIDKGRYFVVDVENEEDNYRFAAAVFDTYLALLTMEVIIREELYA